jgi:hypothetical protein
MAEITLDSVSDALNSLREELTAFRHEVKTDLIRLEAKIDGKPSLMAMFTGIIIVVFGMAGVIASTIGTLHTLGLLK